MPDSFYLAWQYLCHHRWTTGILVASITLILFFPAALQSIIASAEQHFRSRADSTPLVIGPRGSSLELVLRSVYFDQPSDEVMRYQQLRRVQAQKMAKVIPLHTRFTARNRQIVGVIVDGDFDSLTFSCLQEQCPVVTDFLNHPIRENIVGIGLTVSRRTNVACLARWTIGRLRSAVDHIIANAKCFLVSSRHSASQVLGLAPHVKPLRQRRRTAWLN